jgi:PPM family protein phosphatase
MRGRARREEPHRLIRLEEVAMESKLRVHASSDPGRKRSRNEDCHAISMPEDPGDRARRGVLLVVADGMGGSVAGDVASRMAVDAVLRCFDASDGADPLACLRESVETANRDVHEAGRTRADCHGMGTTCTALLVRDRELWIAHVGDSRAYLVRDGRSRQLTEDHSLVAALVRRHEITADQARSDSRRNLVTRCIGPKSEVEVDAGRIDEVLEPGDTLVLCSDGLYGQVADREMVALMANPSLEKACRDLIDLANRRGGPDNITVVAARVEALGIEQVNARMSDLEGPERRRQRRAWWRSRPHDSGSARGGAPPAAGRYVFAALALAIAVLAWVLWMGLGDR